MVFGLPVAEFLLLPFFRRCLQLTILHKVYIALAILVSSLIVTTAIEFSANHHGNDGNSTCSLTDINVGQLSLPDYKWMALPYIMISLSQFLLFVSVSEFLCAQAPYSMKGLLFGLMYGLVGLFTIVGYGIMRLLQWVAEKWLSSIGYGCLSWYLLMALGLLLIILLFIFMVFTCYKNRVRGDG